MKFELRTNPSPTSPEDHFIGRIEFSQEEREGRLPACVEVTGRTCLIPDCGCGEVCLDFPSLDPADTSGFPRLIVLFTEDQIAKAEFKDSPDQVFRTISQKFPALVTEEHWKAVRQLYRETRTHIAETCDVTTFEVEPDYLSYIAENPDEDEHEASLRDLFDFPFDTGDVDGTTWIFEEFYPVPHTPEPLWVTLEFRTTETGLIPDLTEDQLEMVSDDADSVPELHCPTLRFRWNLDSGEIVEMKRIKTDVPASRFLQLLLSVHPDARERFRKRHLHLVDSIARIGAPPESDLPESLFSGSSYGGNSHLDDGPPPLSIPLTRELPKVGRNDPCPCGSGKKFKKCCGG